MTVFLGLPDASALAAKVLTMNTEQRCELLRDFYMSQNNHLAPVCDVLVPPSLSAVAMEENGKWFYQNYNWLQMWFGENFSTT